MKKNWNIQNVRKFEIRSYKNKPSYTFKHAVIVANLVRRYFCFVHVIIRVYKKCWRVSLAHCSLHGVTTHSWFMRLEPIAQVHHDRVVVEAVTFHRSTIPAGAVVTNARVLRVVFRIQTFGVAAPRVAAVRRARIRLVAWNGKLAVSAHTTR